MYKEPIAIIASGGLKSAPPVFQTVLKAALEQNPVIPTTLEDGVAISAQSLGQNIIGLRYTAWWFIADWVISISIGAFGYS